MAKKKTTGKDTGPTRDINRTIGDLGLDPDLDPETAAQVAAAAVANSETVVDDDYGDDDEIASTVVVDNVSSDDLASAAEEDEENERVEIPPPVADRAEDRPLVPSPQTTPQRAKTRERSTPAGKLGKSIAEKVPGAEKIKVYRREKGQRWFVNDYTKSDLATFPDFESFLVRYVQPDYGAGEYDLVGVDAANREIELGQIRLKGVPQQTMEGGAINLLQQMMAKQDEQAKEYVARVEKMMAPQPQTDPLQLLAGVMQMSDQMREKNTPQGDGGMSAMLEMMGQSSDKSMQMMMMMMAQQQQAAQHQAAQQAAQQQQQMQMMMAMMQPKPDPLMDLIKARMIEDGGLGGGGGGNAPPPPPPPVQKESTAELITALAGFMAATQGGGGGEAPPDDFKDFLQQMLLKQQSEGLGVKEVIGLLMSEKNKPGTDDFRAAVDNMAAIMNIANNVNRQQEGGPTAGFFDAVAALFSNRDFAGSMANAIRAKAGGPGGQQGAPQQQLPPVVRQLMEQNQALRQQLQAQGRGVAPGMQQPQPVQTVTQQPPRQAPPQKNVAPMPTPTEEPEGLPELPANTADHINRVIEATDEAGVVEAVITMFIYYAEFDEWKVFSENFFDHVRRGNQREALKYIGALFGGLAQRNIIDRELALKILGAFKNNFGEIQTHLDDIILNKDEVITGDDLLAVDEEAAGEEDGDAEEGGDESTE